MRKRSMGGDVLFLYQVTGEPRAATDTGEGLFQPEGSSIAEYF